MNTIKPIAWKMQIHQDADGKKAANAMRERLRKHVDTGAGQRLEFEDATNEAGERFVVALLAEPE